MIVAIMQPYFYPYLGYFQLMAAADVFVFLDDVQYIRSGWSNRNRILINGSGHWWTRPVRRDQSFTSTYLQREYSRDKDESLLQKLAFAYRDAPYGQAVCRSVEESLTSLGTNVADFNVTTCTQLAQELGSRSRIVRASSLDIAPSLRGSARVLAICTLLGADRYINSTGGLHLYSDEEFSRAGVALSFLKTRAPADDLGPGTPPGYLSVLHELAFRDTAALSERVDQYELLSGRELAAEIA